MPRLYNGKRRVSHKWISIRKRIKLDPYISYYMKKKKVNSKWIKDLNIKPDIIKLPK